MFRAADGRAPAVGEIAPDFTLPGSDGRTGGSQYIFPGVRARHRRQIDALLGLAECMTLMGTTPEAIANNLVFFQVDLKDVTNSIAMRSRPHGECATASSAHPRRLAAGDLVRCDAGRLAAGPRDDQRIGVELVGDIAKVHSWPLYAGTWYRVCPVDLGPTAQASTRAQAPLHAGSVPLRKRGQTPAASALVSPEP